MNKRISIVAACALAPVLVFVASTSNSGGTDASETTARNRYIGAKACMNCHKDEAKGDQYHKWADRKGGHAHAYTRLASPEAKAVAAKAGIEDPQKSEKCLQCHVTAFGEKKRLIKKGFDMTLGVQCESCHGPGEQHAKIRFKEASSGKANPEEYTKIPADEIISATPASTCLECHNEKSPTYQPFCFKKRRAEIAHLNPLKKRTPEEMKALEHKCGPEVKCKECASDKTDEKKTPEKSGDKKTGEPVEIKK